jgi:CheY-like chemotaxis protein
MTPNQYVLMLEDDSDDRYFTQSTIDELGLDVTVRYTPFSDEVLESLSENDRPSLILLAHNIYPKAGAEIIRKFKGHRDFAHVPIIVLSEDIPAQHVQDYYKSGANTVIKKPLSVAMTRQKVQTFFRYWMQVAEIG